MMSEVEDALNVGPEPDPPPLAHVPLGPGTRVTILIAVWILAYAVLSSLLGGPLSPAMMFYFPWGLFFLLGGESGLGEGLGTLAFGWIMYLGLGIAMLRPVRRSTYFALLAVLCLLLALNIKGCVDLRGAFESSSHRGGL